MHQDHPLGWLSTRYSHHWRSSRHSEHLIMRSFWIRIFVTFWIIEILIIAALVSLRGSVEDFTLYPISEKALTSMAFSAEEAYQAGQCNELTPLLRRFERVYKVTPHLFD